MSYRNTGPLLVTGAAGQLGRRVIHHLLATEGVPAKDIIAVTRKPEALADLAAKGVVVRQGSFDDAAGLKTAFAGAKRVLIISTDRIDAPGAREVQHANAVNAAAAAGVKHIVYTSMYGCDPGCPVTTLAPSHYATEQALAKSGLSWTVLRHTWYMDGQPGTLAQSLKFGGQLVTAGNDQPVNYVTREDCARVDAAALASDSTTTRATSPSKCSPNAGGTQADDSVHSMRSGTCPGRGCITRPPRRRPRWSSDRPDRASQA